MGDYSKLIVSCTTNKGLKKEQLLEKLEDFQLYDSAYQSQEKVISIEKGREDGLEIVLVGQRKWGRGIEDFCEWLRPFVAQGSGDNDVFAMEFSEYCTSPRLYTMELEIKTDPEPVEKETIKGEK
jgi:hypothetical protein